MTYTYEKDPVAPPKTSPVPEPATLGLVSTGLLGAIAATRRRLLRS